MASLRTGLGGSMLTESTSAGKEAATAALEELGEERAALVVVYASARHELPALLAGIHDVLGDVPLVGATTHGHFHDGRLVSPGGGVSVLAMSAGRYRLALGAGGGLRQDPTTAGATLARAAVAELADPSPHTVLLLLSCGRTGDQQHLVNGAHQVLGSLVPIVGGAAAVDREEAETAVFFGDRVLEDSAVGVLIGSDEPIRISRRHGWRAHGVPLLVSDSEGTLIRSIGGRPAVEVVREVLRQADEERGEPVDGRGEDGMTRLGARGRCFGIIEPDGSHLLRGGVITDGGEVRTWAPFPPYSTIQIMSCDNEALVGACDDVAGDLVGDTALILAFSCLARFEMLGRQAGEEAARLQAAALPARTFGFYTYGEFARTVSPLGFHNATITAIGL